MSERQETISKTALLKRQYETVPGIVLDYLISLLPVIIWSVYVFGWRALTVIAVSAFSGTLFQLLLLAVSKKSISSFDFIGSFIGVLLSLVLPVTTPLWVPILGTFFSVVLANGIINKYTQIRFEPVMAGYAVFLTFFSCYISASPLAEKPNAWAFSPAVDAVSGATALNSAVSTDVASHTIGNGKLLDMFFGYEPGAMGEVSVLLLLIAAIYLCVRKTVRFDTSVSFLFTVFIITFFLPQSGFPTMEPNYAVAHLLSGGTVFAAVYLVNFPGVAPVTSSGRILFGVGCGGLTVLFRYIFESEGIAYAVLIMCLMRYPLELLTLPRHHSKSKPSEFKEIDKAIEQFDETGLHSSDGTPSNSSDFSKDI